MGDGRKTQDKATVEARIAKAKETKAANKAEAVKLLKKFEGTDSAELEETIRQYEIVLKARSKSDAAEIKKAKKEKDALHKKALREAQEAFAEEHGLSVREVKKLQKKTRKPKED